MSDSQNFDLIVIGAGPGGYVAAIRAAQLDMKVALVEKMESLGGTCLNVGCIPSKAMLDSSGHFHSVNHSFADHGISVKSASVDLEKMIGRKFSVVKKLTDGVAGLIKGNKITRVDGIGVLVPASAEGGPHSVEVYKNKQPVWEQSLGGIDQKADGSVGAKSKPSTVLSAPKIVLAMGSQPVELPFMPFDGESIVSSTGALSLKDIPKSMLIVGAGAIGLEMAQVWASLGTKVTVVEMMKQILPGWDAQIAKTMQR